MSGYGNLCWPAELYTAEYHPVEHRADIEVKGDVANISFLPVVPNTIRVQVEQVESTSNWYINSQH